MNARARYRITHWGKGGHASTRELLCPDPRKGGLVELGQLLSLVYLTQKGGDDGPTEYEHDFNARRLPVLAFNDDGLFILGGGYRIGARGIHG